MKGYFVGEGYMGYVDGEYLLFADESDYRDYMITETIWKKSNSMQQRKIRQSFFIRISRNML